MYLVGVYVIFSIMILSHRQYLIDWWPCLSQHVRWQTVVYNRLAPLHVAIDGNESKYLRLFRFLTLILVLISTLPVGRYSLTLIEIDINFGPNIINANKLFAQPTTRHDEQPILVPNLESMTIHCGYISNIFDKHVFVNMIESRWRLDPWTCSRPQFVQPAYCPLQSIL